MIKKFQIIYLIFAFIFCGQVYAQAKEYVRDYNYTATDYDSKYTSRIYALDGVKQDLLHELGSYVHSVIKISKNSLGDSYMSEDMVNLTAGVISLKVLDEKWDRISYYIKAIMKADQDEVLNAIKELRNNLELKRSLKESFEELEVARNEIKKLRKTLNDKQLSRTESVKKAKQYNYAIMAMEAEMLFQKALQSHHKGNFSNAVTILKDLAKQGYVPAQSRLGQMYERARGVENDYEKAIFWYSEALKKNYVKALARMGFMYERGLGVGKNLEKAAELYQKAMKKGNKLGTARLGYLYETGGGVERDIEKAVELYKYASDKGNNQGRVRLGQLYQRGEEVDQDFDEARRLYTLAAENGSGFGMMRLGTLYYKGQGVAQSDEEAYKYFKASDEYGNPSGAARLGHMYEKGLGGADQDMDKAVELYRKGAVEGGVYALFKMGHIHHKGKGVDRDLNEAVKWYRLASDRGHKKAKKRLKKLLRKLDRD